MRERWTTGNRRRRAAAPTLSVILWRDIPAQLTARADGRQHKLLLHARFQHAIDRAAAVAGLTSTDDYVRQWRTVPGPLAVGDVDAQLDQRCAAIEAAYPRARLEALVAAGGLDEEGRADGVLGTLPAPQADDPGEPGDPDETDETDEP
jgi:hypothetical protein